MELPGGIISLSQMTTYMGCSGPPPLLCWKESAMLSVRECEEECCVEGTMVVMGIEDGLLANGRARGDSPSTALEHPQWHSGQP